MSGGLIWAFMFFLLLCFAAITSTISVLEVIVAYFSEQLNMSRKRAAILAMISVGFLGILCTVSPKIFGSLMLLRISCFLLEDSLSWFLLDGFFQVIKPKRSFPAMVPTQTGYYGLFMFLVKFVAPLAIAFLFALGVYSKVITLFPSIGG